MTHQAEPTVNTHAHLEHRGEGLPVVALHGNAVDHRILLALDPVLEAASGLERYYLDLPGFGQTPALPGLGGLPEIADWLIAEIAELIGQRPFAILANSMGGLLARHVRAHLPEQVIGLALIAPAVHTDMDQSTLPTFTVTERDDDFLASLPNDEDKQQYTGMAARQTPETWELFRRFVLPGLQAADPIALQRLNTRYFLKPDLDERGGTFTGPTLVVTGRQDHIVGYHDQQELVRNWYPHATYAALHGAGHNVHFDRRTTTSALLHDWAADLPR